MWNACTMKLALSMPCICRNDVHLICEIHSPVYSERNPTFSSKRQISLWFPKNLTNDLVWWYIRYLKCCLLYEVLLQSRIKYYGYFVSNMKYKLLHKQKIVMDIQMDGPFIYYIPHHWMLKKIQNDCSFATFVYRHVNGLLWIVLIKHKYPSQL